MASLITAPKIQFFDANGNPLVGGKLYSYAAGTTTPQSTFTNYAGTTPNTNPVVLDSRGEANVWLGTSSYKFKLTNAADVEIWTVDNVDAGVTLAQLAASGGSSLIGFLQSGTGAVATTVQSKLRETVSATDFGITGSGDESVKLQAFIDELSSSRKLGFLNTTVSFATDLKFKSNVTLIGTGENFGGCLNPTGSAKILVDGVAAGTTYVQHLQVENILIYGGNSTAQNVMEIRNGYSNYFKNVRFHDVDINTNANKTGILIEGDADIRFDNLEIHGGDSRCKYNIYMTGGQATFVNPDLENSAGASFYISGGAATIVNPYLERFSVYGIQKTGSSYLSIMGGEVVHSGGAGTPIIVQSDDFHISGTNYYDSTAGSNPYLVTIQNTSITPANINRNVVCVGIPLSQIDEDDVNTYGAKVHVLGGTTDRANTMSRRVFSRAITLSDNVATTFFRVYQTGATTATLACRFRVWAQSAGYGKGFTEYVTLITRAGGSAAFTPLTQVFNNAQNSSANWSITLTGSATAPSANEVDFQATIDLTGALNSGTTNVVYCTLEIEGPIAAWRVSEP